MATHSFPVCLSHNKCFLNLPCNVCISSSKPTSILNDSPEQPNGPNKKKPSNPHATNPTFHMPTNTNKTRVLIWTTANSPAVPALDAANLPAVCRENDTRIHEACKSVDWFYNFAVFFFLQTCGVSGPVYSLASFQPSGFTP